LPFHSVDATNWEIRPCQFGEWEWFGDKLSIRGSDQPLRAEVEAYLKRERVARERWRKEMELLQDTDAPTIRLAVVNSGREAGAGLMKPITVDL
jgi:CO/xanthine dehydrogenase Mo-binding subunit